MRDGSCRLPQAATPAAWLHALFAALGDQHRQLQGLFTVQTRIDLRLVGALENIFTYNGSPGHEIVLIYDGEFLDKSLYKRSFVPGTESNGQPFQAKWRGVEYFSTVLPLYPHGLLELLRSSANRHAP